MNGSTESTERRSTQLMEDFLEKYCKRVVPHRNVLQQRYLSACFEQKMCEIKNDFKTQKIWTVGAIIRDFSPSDSDAIRQSQIAFDSPGIRGDLAFIKSHFDILPGAIGKLESRNLTLIESLDIVSDVGNELKLVPGSVGKLVQEKFNTVLRNNPGFDRILEIGMVLRGEHVQTHLPPADVIAMFKYAPIQSCEVERSFSAYKNILADNRMRFTPENLEKFLICNTNKEK